MPRKKSYKLDRVAIRMVKEPPLYSEDPVDSAEAAIKVMRDTFQDYDREVICLVNLKSNLQPINLNIVSMGALDQAMVHPRELLKSTVLSNAASVIIMHNHPSGKLEPSSFDIAMTDRMQQIFSLMGIDIVDHVIIGDCDSYYSFREHKEMPVGQPHYSSELAEIRLKEQFPLKQESVLAESKHSYHSSRKDKLNAIMKKLEEGVKDLFTSENYQKYLRTMSQFHKYSFNNTILIALQKPDATLVAGYGAWQQKFHRQVKKGEKGITILAPMPIKAKAEPTATADHTATVRQNQNVNYQTTQSGAQDPDAEKTMLLFRPVSVFDISQTDGEPLPSIGVDELTGSAKGYAAFMQAMTALTPVPIRFDEIDSGAKGYYHTANKEIVIQKDMSESQTMKTCVHEVSHAILHDRDLMKAEGIVKDRQTKEVEAESVAFAVCAHFMLDTSDYSFPYIAGWSSSVDMKELKSSMDTIRKTAGEIIDGIEAEMEKQQDISKGISTEKPSLLAALSKEKEQLQAGRPETIVSKTDMIADQPHRLYSGKELVR